MDEGEFNRRWSKALTDAGALVFAVVASAMQSPGWPDRHVTSTRWTGWIEGKVEEAMPRALQLERMQQLCLRGASVWIMRLLRRDCEALRRGLILLEAPTPTETGLVDPDRSRWLRLEVPVRKRRVAEVDGEATLRLLADKSPGLLTAWHDARVRARSAHRLLLPPKGHL